MRALNRILVVLSLCSSPALATPASLPVLMGANVTEPEFRSFVRDHQRETLSEAFDAARPGLDLEDKLKRNLEQAQKTWLSAAVTNSREPFREVAALANRGDWRTAERQAILYAHLRVAQLTDSPLEHEEFVTRAARLFPDLEADSTLFPPPLISEFNTAQTHARAQATPVPLNEIFADFRFVFIDGIKIDLESKSIFRMTEGTHRITAVSDRSGPITLSMTAHQLSVFRAHPEPIVNFPCGAAPKTTNIESMGTSEIFDGQTCAALAAVPAGSSSSPMTTPTQAVNWVQPPTEVSQRAKHDWLWIGVGAVVLASAYAIYRAQHAQHSDPGTSSTTAAARPATVQNPPPQLPVPTHTEGF